ncbi:MAG TPA: hypothetical protein VIT38_16275 [Allosphingosinicella sp.]|jgi:hypothetical protein
MSDFQIPSAKDNLQRLALVEAEEAAKEARAQVQAEEERKALIDQLTKPSGISDEEAIQRAVKLIESAVRNRKNEIQVYRFPNRLCTDGGRAINQGERGWEDTLVGIPQEILALWQRHFKDKGYGMRVEIVDFPNGMPGDVGMTLTWA